MMRLHGAIFDDYWHYGSVLDHHWTRDLRLDQACVPAFFRKHDRTFDNELTLL
jgi:hypothetical protein